MKKIGWENGTLVSKAKVSIGGNIYDVEPEQYEGNTPLSAENLKKMEDNMEEGIEEVKKIATKKVLWENISSLTTFNAQNITLSSGEYDYLIIYAYRNYAGSAKKSLSVVVERNKSIEINYCDYFDGRTRAWSRLIEIGDGVNISIGNATIEGSTSNNVLIPYKIIGCKY